MLFASFSSFADHETTKPGSREKTTTPTFAELARAYKNATENHLGFRLKNGECFTSPDKSVSKIFRHPQFSARIEAAIGTSSYTAKFSTPNLAFSGEFEDETFHDTRIGLGYRSARTGGGPGNMYRNFTIPIPETYTTSEPNKILGVTVSHKNVERTRERHHDVAISHDTRKAMFRGKQAYILEAVGNSTDFQWNSKVLYYCIFPISQ